MRARLCCALALVATVAGAPVARADPDTTPPSASFALSGRLTAEQVVSFSEAVRNVTESNVIVRRAGVAESLGASRSCRDSTGAPAECGAGPVISVAVRAAEPLVAGQEYEVVVNPEGSDPVVDLASNAAPASAGWLRASVAEQESSAGAGYVWPLVRNPDAVRGSYRTERTAGATASFGFTGTRVTWYTAYGPREGKASVRIDGVSKGVFNNYSSRSRVWAGRVFTVRGSGSHRITVRVRGEVGSRAGGGTWVAVDGFRAGRAAISDQTAATFRWAVVSDRAASGKRYAVTNSRGRVSFRFSGRGVDWFTIAGPDMGKADVSVDGGRVRTYDNWSKARRTIRRTIVGLEDGIHTMKIAVRADKNPKSTGRFVAVDRWVLRAGINDFRHLGTWIDLWDYTSSTSESTIRSMVQDMRSRGVRTLYLQTGRSNTDAFKYPTQAGQWLDAAHSAGIKVVGWYYPTYGDTLQDDIDKTAAIAVFRSAGTQGFDGLAIDIEVGGSAMPAIAKHLAGVRARVGLVFPIGAITFAPLDMDLRVSYWEGFPWDAIGRNADVVMPMGYWSNRRKNCSGGDARYCAYEYARQNILRARESAGLPVHEIGGVGNNHLTAQEVADYVRGCRDARCLGGGIYDYRTTGAAFWDKLDELNG